MAQHKERLALTDTTLDVAVKMSEGNPGAVSVLAQMIKYGGFIEPKSTGFMPILLLDSLGIYGSQIWVLYKDVCKESILNLLSILRYYQLGLMAEGDYLFNLNRDFDAVKTAVKERLPEFNLEVSHGLYS